jgi:hypothetical protein
MVNGNDDISSVEHFDILKTSRASYLGLQVVIFSKYLNSILWPSPFNGEKALTNDPARSWAKFSERNLISVIGLELPRAGANLKRKPLHVADKAKLDIIIHTVPELETKEGYIILCTGINL